MTKYLISFPSGAMVLPHEDLHAVSDASHAVVHEAKDAGVWCSGAASQTSQLQGGYSVLELPSREAALAWAAKIASACRCAQEARAFQYDPAS